MIGPLSAVGSQRPCEFGRFKQYDIVPQIEAFHLFREGVGRTVELDESFSEQASHAAVMIESFESYEEDVSVLFPRLVRGDEFGHGLEFTTDRRRRKRVRVDVVKDLLRSSDDDARRNEGQRLFDAYLDEIHPFLYRIAPPPTPSPWTRRRPVGWDTDLAWTSDDDPDDDGAYDATDGASKRLLRSYAGRQKMDGTFDQ